MIEEIYNKAELAEYNYLLDLSNQYPRSMTEFEWESLELLRSKQNK